MLSSAMGMAPEVQARERRPKTTSPAKPQGKSKRTAHRTKRALRILVLSTDDHHRALAGQESDPSKVVCRSRARHRALWQELREHRRRVSAQDLHRCLSVVPVAEVPAAHKSQYDRHTGEKAR